MATGIKALVGKKIFQDTKFMDEKIKIFKLTVSEVLAVQEAAKEIGKAAEAALKAVEAGGAVEDNDADGFAILKLVIRTAAEGAADLSDEEFNDFPLDELSKLSAAIMKFSGIGEQAGK